VAAINQAGRSGLHMAPGNPRSAPNQEARPVALRAFLRLDPAWGITSVRIMRGLVFAVHGAEKFAAGLLAVIAMFAKMAIVAPQVLAPAIATLELVAARAWCWGS
jgi:hypothetical protein